MKLPAPYKCDYCSNVKGESNHWWVRWTGLDLDRRPSQFVLQAWDAIKAATDDHEHICSESCASKALSKWMSQSANATKPQPVETELKSTKSTW